jgi:hypothetical protein
MHVTTHRPRRLLLKRIAVDLAVVLLIAIYMASFPVAAIVVPQYSPRPVRPMVVGLNDIAYAPLRWYASQYEWPGAEAYDWYCQWARGRTQDACSRASNRW